MTLPNPCPISDRQQYHRSENHRGEEEEKVSGTCEKIATAGN
jgi:hypothetical protein